MHSAKDEYDRKRIGEAESNASTDGDEEGDEVDWTTTIHITDGSPNRRRDTLEDEVCSNRQINIGYRDTKGLCNGRESGGVHEGAERAQQSSEADYNENEVPLDS